MKSEEILKILRWYGNPKEATGNREEMLRNPKKSCGNHGEFIGNPKQILIKSYEILRKS